MFSGKGLFTTSDPTAVEGHPCDWFALQADPEGNTTPPKHPGRLCWWAARPTQAMADEANRRGIPFIAQAESQPELDAALKLVLTVPKALVGNPTAWTDFGFAAAARQGWDLILEWYWNAQPSYTSPNADNYPYFRNVCFGIYSEGVPGGDGHVQQIPLSQYRAVWKGSFSVWKAEAMTPADWAAFGA